MFAIVFLDSLLVHLHISWNLCPGGQSITLPVQFFLPLDAVKASAIPPLITCRDILSTLILLLSHSLLCHATNEQCCVYMHTLKSPTAEAALNVMSQPTCYAHTHDMEPYVLTGLL